jgi:hypothetical protein
MTSTVIVESERYDETLRLVGDEDCGVSVDCKLCDRRGLPIAYLLTYDGDTTYAGNADVQRVHTITALIDAGQQHLWQLHAA